MKEKLKNKKVVYTIIGIVSVLLVALAVTYAYWLVTKTQDKENEITAGCLDITISGEKNDITLTNQFPMSDEDGMKLVPYEFTVTNNCNTSVDYQVTLEATGTEESAMATSSLKVALNDSVSLLSSKAEVATTISGAYESRVLGYSRLAASGNEGSSATYKLRIWIDEEAPISEMNKTFTSKISVTVGQGLESPYEEGTLAYSILANAGGLNATYELDNTKYAHRITSSASLIISTSDSYYYGTEYTFDETTGKYTLSGTLTQAKISECRNGTKTCGKYTFNDTRSTYSSLNIYEVADFKTTGNTVTVNKIEYTTPFAGLTTSTEAGVYKTQDDLGDSYYYRGNVTNNYVQFGEYIEGEYNYLRCYAPGSCFVPYDTLEECESGGYECEKNTILAQGPIYWRIIRINGDGTIRLIYDGTTKVENGTIHSSKIGSSAYNSNSDNAKYVGYTYDDGTGAQVDSTIKGVVDAWYDKYLETTYGNYIADGIFCNDRSETGKTYYDSSMTITQNPNDAAYIDIYYKSYNGLSGDSIPSLKCTNKEDRYTMDDTTNGNGLLSNPVGLITADEEKFASGTVSLINKSYYLYTGEIYWTSTPYRFSGIERNAKVRYTYNTSENGVNSNYVVRPVINLKADVEFTGDGTINNPYKIVTE